MDSDFCTTTFYYLKYIGFREVLKMSQIVEHVEASNSAAKMRPVSMEPGFDDFNYKPIPPLAVVSLLLGICGLSGLLSPLGLLFAAFGAVLGWVAARQIRSSDGGLSGGWMAQSGVVLSSLLFVGGIALHVYWFQSELPEGCQRLSFSTDISKKGFVIEDNQQKFHPDIEELDGKQVFLKGYMYPEGQVEGIKTFILCRDNGDCCFGGQPKLTDMIKVRMAKGTSARMGQGMVSVAGTFRLRDLRRAGNLEPAFELEASHFGPAKTWY